jgi:hypothetical protein
MFELTLNNDKYTLIPGRYFSYLVLQNGEKVFSVYPYKKPKDQFIVSLFKTQLNFNDIKFVEPAPAAILKNDISTVNELILNNLEQKQQQQKQENVVKKKNINNFKKF